MFLLNKQTNNLNLSGFRRHAFVHSLTTLFGGFWSAVLFHGYSSGNVLPVVFVLLYRSSRVFKRDELLERPYSLGVVDGNIIFFDVFLGFFSFFIDGVTFFERGWRCALPLNDALATSRPADGFAFVRGAAVFVRGVRAVSRFLARFWAWLLRIRSAF